MRSTSTFATLAAVAAAATIMFAAPQSANALPQAGDAKQVTKSSNVEKVGYYGRRHWRNRGYYGHRRYHRRPGFGVYLGF